MITIVGQGLVGTLVGLEAERRGQSFRMVDEGSGLTASRAAAGFYNPLTGPRFSPSGENWHLIVPHYRNLEEKLGVELLHPLVVQRPLLGAKVAPEQFPRSAPGWNAELSPPWRSAEGPAVDIVGGGWLDIPRLLDTARARWLALGILEERRFELGEGLGQTVFWCCGPTGFLDSRWSEAAGVKGVWQIVRGDVLTVRIGQLNLSKALIGKRFLLPLGKDLYRWGATHESDVIDFDFRESAKALLEAELNDFLGNQRFEVVDHRWGLRPASRTGKPLRVAHPDEKGWTLLNGFGGRGVSQLPGVLQSWEF